MIYGKLPIVLLSALASQADDTTECRIATYILRNEQEAACLNIVQLAEKCHVSVSSISRFCRSIGLGDYAELRALISEWDRFFIPDSLDDRPAARMDETFRLVHEGIERLHRSIDPEQIRILGRKIDAYEHIYLLGLLKAGTAAQALQADLLLLGKNTVCKVAFAQQLECMRQATYRDLILIFSYSGIYFDYLTGPMPQGLSRAHVVLITGNKNVSPHACVDQVIAFDSMMDQASHPFQMQAVARLIAQEYAFIRCAGKHE